jgi:hypothetical protein
VTRVGLLTLIVFVALAPAAHAWPTLSARFRTTTVTPFMTSAMETTRAGGIGSGVNQSPVALPVLVAPSYATMALTFSQPAEGVTADFGGGRTVAAKRDSDTAFTLTLPDYAPGNVSFLVAYSTAEVTGRAEYHLTLAPQPPFAARLQAKGSRMRVRVLCSGPCTGRVTVTTRTLRRIARAELARDGWVTLEPRAAALRYIRRHKLERLRVAIDSAGAERTRSTLTIDRWPQRPAMRSRAAAIAARPSSSARFAPASSPRRWRSLARS